MGLSCYCKHCGREVPPGDTCSVCGGKLNANQAHLVWRAARTPVKDWMCWNAAMRIVLPVSAMVMALALWVEGLSHGLAGVEAALLGGGWLRIMGLLLAAATLLIWLTLLLRGPELLICTMDSKGIHLERYLPSATALKLLMRFKSPALLRNIPPDGPTGPLKLDHLDLPWKDIARIQLWPEKNLILFYAPSWWQRMALPCTPFTWQDALDYIRHKLGRKKQVTLPASLRETGAR